MVLIEKDDFSMKERIKNVSISIAANMVTIFVSLIITLILPKIVTVEQYGYWQIYLFYTTYVGVLHFGLNDGIYLRYGGEEYKKLDYKKFNGQFRVLFMIELIAMIVIIFFACTLNDITYKYIWVSLGICTFLSNIRYMYIYILQATNRIKEFAIITIIDRAFFVLFIFAFWMLNIIDGKTVIVSDLLGRVLSLILGGFFCKEIVLEYKKIDQSIWHEIRENIISGSQLMLANLASSCIIGAVRYGIQRNWDVTLFGKISLMLSISNFFVIFINALGIVIYPLLRREDDNNRSDLYFAMEKILDFVLIFSLLLYYPVQIIIRLWLPQYSDVMQYICILYPVYVFEGKMALLYNTYLKVYRKEKVIFKINSICVCISALYTYFSTYMLKNLNAAVFGMLLLIAFRCFVGQVYCAKLLNKHYIANIVSLIFMVCVYFFDGFYLNGPKGFFSLLVMIGIYGVINAFNIKKAIKILIN